MKAEKIIGNVTSGPFYIEHRDGTDKYLIMLREGTTHDGRVIASKKLILFADEIAEGQYPFEFVAILEGMAARIKELAEDPSRGYRFGIPRKFNNLYITNGEQSNKYKGDQA